MKIGKVYLVGAGPGDPGLLTQKGMQILSAADVIIYDYLLDERLMDLAPPEVEKIYAGKNASQHAMEQDEINRLLVNKARQGKLVVRLKGGDPFVFGRGGEEAEALAEGGIPFEIIPGISSAVAVPAYAGIPLTHRASASSFAVITGHENPAKENSSIHWEQLANGVDTLVFLMGMANLSQIAAKLIEHGRPAHTPVAVIKDGTKPAQKTVTGTLKDIVEKVKAQRLGPPAVVVVGDVVLLRKKLRWFDNRPLSTKRVLVTRARHQASVLSRLLAENGAQPVELPAIDIQCIPENTALDSAISNLPGYQWIIFTSVNGVEAFFERMRIRRMDSRALKGIKIGAIGPATAAILEQRGVFSDYIPTVFTGEGLITGLKEIGVSGQNFLLPRADIADNALGDGLRGLGANVDEIPAYRTIPATEHLIRAKRMLSDGLIDVITFTSSSTVSNLVAVFGEEDLNVKGAKIACIGPKTADTAKKAGLKVDILADEQTIPGLVEAIKHYFRRSKDE